MSECHTPLEICTKKKTAPLRLASPGKSGWICSSGNLPASQILRAGRGGTSFKTAPWGYTQPAGAGYSFPALVTHVRVLSLCTLTKIMFACLLSVLFGTSWKWQLYNSEKPIKPQNFKAYCKTCLNGALRKFQFLSEPMLSTYKGDIKEEISSNVKNLLSNICTVYLSRVHYPLRTRYMGVQFTLCVRQICELSKKLTLYLLCTRSEAEAETGCHLAFQKCQWIWEG